MMKNNRGNRLGNKNAIKAVGYSPRNDRNNIMKGMGYELLYWDNGWKSSGRKVASSSDELIFDSVPDGALLWLHNHTEGQEERIFLYENGKQVWW
jgi:hypothetical protein